MHRLTATFQFALPNELRVKRLPEDSLRYAATVDGFEVTVDLLRNGGAKIMMSGERLEIRAARELKVSVSREENSAPPHIVGNGKGGRDVTERRVWLEKLEPDYVAVALKVVNRVIRFFKYEMKTPHLREYEIRDAGFRNPVWIDEGGNRLAPGVIRLSSRMLRPPGTELLGEKDFTAGEDAKLSNVLQNDITVETHREFLSDAQNSILERKWKRAILEMAIACEVAVKQAFFAKASAAGAAFEYLEDKRRVSVRVIELMDGAAKLAFGSSFKDDDNSAYEQVDYLFRARNKVAHRGEMIYRDRNDVVQQVDRATLEKWWTSVAALMKWIGERQTH